MNVKKIYLVFSDTGTLLTRAINICTKSTLNHASIAFDEGLEEVFSFGRKSPRNPFIGGFVKEDMQNPLFRKAKCAIYSLTITELEYSQIRKRITQMEEKKQDYRYNLIGLFGVMVNIEMQRKNAFFCSQFVATILSESGIYHNSKPSCLVKPQDLREWHQLELIFQGDLSNYPHLIEQQKTKQLVKKLNKVCS